MNANGSGTSRRPMARRLLALTSVCALAVAVVAPQGAWAANYQPDVFVKGGFARYVYDPSGSGESKTLTIHAGETRVFHYWVGNEGTLSDTFTYEGCSAFGPFRLKWLDWTGADVTYPVIWGTYAPGDVYAPGISGIPLDLRLKAKASADRGDVYYCTVLATSNGDGTADAAGYRVRVVS